MPRAKVRAAKPKAKRTRLVSRKSARLPAPKKINSLLWLFEPLERRGDFLHKKMFGCEAAYMGDKLTAVLAEGDEPWNGLLIATSREQHESLIKEFYGAQKNAALAPHQILGKWLYLSSLHPDFEELAPRIIQKILRLDPRIGVAPKPKNKKPKK